MRDWITLDATGLTLHVPPVPDGLVTLLWLAGFGVVLFLLLALLRSLLLRAEAGARIARNYRRVTTFLRRHYLKLLMPYGILAIVLAGAIYIWRIPGLIGDLLVIVRAEIADPAAGSAANSASIRNLAYAFAAFTGTLAILATIPFQLVRVWINERTARTGEENLTTDLINKAVEGLGAEKEISEVWRTVRHTRDGDVQTAYETRTEPAALPAGAADIAPGPWTLGKRTRPNIEVRLGAIYALERIAQDSDRDHIRIMEILCAYIRENAPASGASDHVLGAWSDHPDTMTADESEARAVSLGQRRYAHDGWSSSLPKPRTDIVAAIEVVGRRSATQIDLELRHRHRQGAETYRLDLRAVNLQAADLSHLNLGRALLAGARMEGADLSGARMEGADLSGARMEGANLFGARMEGAVLSGADFRNANWAGASNRASPAQFADFRGGQDLTQAQLDHFIGNAGTLLPDRPNEHGEPFHVWSCWDTPPPGLDAIVTTAAGRFADDADRAELRRQFLCGRHAPIRIGTPLPVDAPRPPGHPLETNN